MLAVSPVMSSLDSPAFGIVLLPTQLALEVFLCCATGVDEFVVDRSTARDDDPALGPGTFTIVAVDQDLDVPADFRKARRNEGGVELLTAARCGPFHLALSVASHDLSLSVDVVDRWGIEPHAGCLQGILEPQFAAREPSVSPERQARSLAGFPSSAQADTALPPPVNDGFANAAFAVELTTRCSCVPMGSNHRPFPCEETTLPLS